MVDSLTLQTRPITNEAMMLSHLLPAAAFATAGKTTRGGAWRPAAVLGTLFKMRNWSAQFTGIVPLLPCDTDKGP